MAFLRLGSLFDLQCIIFDQLPLFSIDYRFQFILIVI